MTMRVAMTAICSRALPVQKSFSRKAALLASAMAAVFTAPAFAQDTLRGSYVTSPQYYQWDGFYGGAQVNYNIGSAKFNDATQPLTDYILRNNVIRDEVSQFTTLPNGSTTGNSWGGFIGYNWQWDDVVVGVEANYSRMNLFKDSSDSLRRLFIDNGQAPPGYTYTYDITVTGDASVKVTDLATFRARAGWSVGSLLPYAFLAFAVARADVTTRATVSGTREEMSGGVIVAGPYPLDFGGPQVSRREGVFTYGGAIGLGFDWALTQNLFVRGEYEYLQLQAIEGIDIRLNTVRAAVGLKF